MQAEPSPLSVIGLAMTNVARMVVGDINAKGGVLGDRGSSLKIWLPEVSTPTAGEDDRTTADSSWNCVREEGLVPCEVRQLVRADSCGNRLQLK